MGLSPSPRRFSDRHLVHGGLLRLAAAGLASAIAYWIRPEGLEVVLVAMICLVWQGFRANWPWRRMALSGAALAGTALLVAAPYPILAGKITSKQIPFAKAQPVPTFISQQAEVRPNVPAQPNVDTQPGVNVQPSVGVQPKDEVCPAMALPSPAVAPDAVVARPVQPETRYSAGLVVRLAGKALASLVVSICQGLKFAFIPLYLLGQWELVRRKPDWFTIGFLWFLAILHMLILLGVYFLSGYIAHRHVLPLVGLAMPFVALGIVGAGEKLAWLCKVQPRHAALATLLVCTALVLPYSLRPYNREFLPVIAATKWVQQHAEPGEGIVCNSPYVAFYGTLPTTVLGPEGPSLDLALAKAPANTRFDYVVLHVGAYDYRPEWQTQVEERYRQVLCLPDPYATTRVRKVLVFESKDRQARKAASRSPS